MWELARFVKNLDAPEADALRETAEQLDLTPMHIETALRYYADFPDEIDERVRMDEEEARGEEASWPAAEPCSVEGSP